MNTLWFSESQEVSEKLSLEAQRNLLLELNPDIIYWVYDLKSNTDNNIDLEWVEDVMTIYPNQLNNIKWLDKASDIIVCDLNSLRKWEFKILAWNSHPTYTRNGFNNKWGFKTELDDWHTMNVSRNLVLLSNGVIEYIESKNKNWESKKHLITTLRDGWAADKLQRTTTAGRNVGYNLSEETEREHFEEWPFLWKNDNWEFVLCIPWGNKDWEEYTKQSVLWWLENKYNLSRENEQDNYFIKAFERNFPGIKYEELWNILREIVENNRFMTYEWEGGNIDELTPDMANVSMLNGNTNSLNAFVYFDQTNNTIEYRQIRRIKAIPEWFHLLWNRPCKLFLESQNQYSRVPRIENAWKNAVPTIAYVSWKVKDLLQK